MSGFVRTLARIAVPVTLQSMLQASFSIIDQVMIGQLGEESIAAVGLCGNFTLIFSVVMNAVGAVAGILIAQFLGAGDRREAWCSFFVSSLTGTILASLFTFAAALFPAPILSLYTNDAGILRAGCLYFPLIALAYIPMALSNVFSAYLRCKEHAGIPFLASLISVFVNTGLNYVLIFGALGAPTLGIQGAGIATLVSQLVNLGLILPGLIRSVQKDGDRPVFTLSFTRIRPRDYLIMILPILVSEFLWSLGQNVESAFYGHLGTDSLAAYTLTSPVQSLVVGALSGLSAASGVIVGKRLGSRETDAAYQDSKKIMIAGLFGSVLVSVLLIFLTGTYVSFYNVSDAVRATGRILLMVFALYAPVKVENMILGGGILKSGGDTKTVLVIDTLGTWCVGIPLCLLAARVLHFDIVGVYSLLTTEEIFRLVLSLVVFRKKKWMISLS